MFSVRIVNDRLDFILFFFSFSYFHFILIYRSHNHVTKEKNIVIRQKSGQTLVRTDKIRYRIVLIISL